MNVKLTLFRGGTPSQMEQLKAGVTAAIVFIRPPLNPR